MASGIARHPEINYLDALSLLRQGFPPELVFELLLAGHRPVF